MKKVSTFSAVSLIVLLFSVISNAAIPNGYYNSLNGKSTSDLKTAVCKIISTLPVHDENYYYNSLPMYFQKTDVHPNTNPVQWWDMYSGMTSYTKNGMKGLNREHSFPKSWWGGGMDTPAYTDLNHLYPSEAAANVAKSNYPLGEVATSTFDNGWTKVGYAVSGQGGGAAKVFEPADEYKGDFARTYFYMATCYQNLTWRYTYMVSQNLYPTLTTWAQNLLLKWSREDPVSQKEIDRNEQVYIAQGNRNPYIDNPQLCEYIWGNKKGEAFIAGDTPSEGDPTLLAPENNTSLDFGQIAIGKSITTNLFLKGENLTKNITITIYGNNASMFKSSFASIDAAKVNETAGYQLPITYTPTAIGSHSTTLIISDGGLTGSYIVTLKGEALAVPTLSRLTATEATDNTGTSYTANWEVPADDVVDYYLLTRTVYKNGNQEVTTYDAETNSYSIDNMESGTTESYYVQSVRLGYMSEPSNIINVSPGSVSGVQAEQGLVILTDTDGSIVFRCSKAHTQCRIYNMESQEIANLPIIENNTILSLPKGVYIVRTNEITKPIKVVIK